MVIFNELAAKGTYRDGRINIPTGLGARRGSGSAAKLDFTSVVGISWRFIS